MEQLDVWYSHLGVREKESLAKKNYPACTAWWLSLTEEEKRRVYTSSVVPDRKRGGTR